jgi:hypothetical protein
MPSLSGPDRSKDTPAKVASASKGLNESLEDVPVTRRELTTILPPPAPAFSGEAKAFLADAVLAHDMMGNSFGVPRTVNDEFKGLGWFEAYKDWDRLTQKGREAIPTTLAGEFDALLLQACDKQESHCHGNKADLIRIAAIRASLS